MSTNINISVGDNKLLDQARLQQNASRQAQLEKEANKRLEAQAADARTKELAAQGLDANGNPVFGSRLQVPQLERRPAANRFGVDEAITMSWIVVGSNNWYANIQSDASGTIIRALQTTYTGTNDGRSLHISSTDGTYWHSIVNSADLKAPAGFTPGEATSMGATNETYRLDTGINNYVFDLFPVGKGTFVATFRFTLAYQKARWAFSMPSPPTPVYTINLNQATPVTTIYKSFLVSTSAVKEISTPQPVQDYFAGKFPGVIQTSKSLRRYTTGYVLEKRTTPDPNLTLLNDWGSVVTFDFVQGAYNLGARGPRLWWLNGWWQNAMPSITGILSNNSALIHGAPAVFSRAINSSTNWPNYFNSVDANGVVVNDFSSWFNWFVNSYTQDQSKMIKPLAYYVSAYSNLYGSPMAVQLPVYQARTALPTGYAWYQGISPRISPSDTSYWKLLKSLSFSAQAQAMPSVPSVTSNDSASNGPDQFFCVTTDWGAPAYCRQQALALGFTSADLTP